jgi:uncharacterized protein
MKCPNCKESKLVISERRGIEIDYCPDCRGIWLDRGELDKLLEKDKESHSHVSQERSFKDDRDGHYQKDGYYQKPYKRKKSLLEELFD